MLPSGIVMGGDFYYATKLYTLCHHGMGMQSERERSHCDHLMGSFRGGGGGTMGSCLDTVAWGGGGVGRGGGHIM